MTIALLHAAPQADLWNYWDRSDEGDTRIIDHRSFQNFLDTYRIKENDSQVAKVDYKSVSEQDRERLYQYTQALSQLNIREYNRKEQFAYWVNLYNALTINLILDNYPVKSIRKLSRPWDRHLITINGLDLSLNDIEHRILRPRWKDPRIHFVVNCASMGCPDLPSLVLSAENSEEILSKSTTNYLNHPRGISLDQKKLKISSIFNWYSEDFGIDDKGIVNFLSMYYDFSEIENSTGKSRYDLSFKYEYDWDLNEY
jgi:hypothetical protein